MGFREDTVQKENRPLDENKFSYESIKPEVKSLEGFRELFEVNEAVLKDEFIEPLRNAPTEVAQVMSSTLKQASGIIERTESPALRGIYERQFSEGVEALEFFNTFCSDLNNIESYSVVAEEDDLGGIRLRLSPKDSRSWGEIGGDSVDTVEIIIRNGTKQEDKPDAYTPMQLNFRFLNQDEEVNSWRLDMHNRNRRDIQVDAKVGGDSVSVHHHNIDSLNNSADPEKSFQALQGAFLLNFGRRFLLGRDENNKIVANEKADFETPAQVDIVKREYFKAIKFLKKED